VGFDPVDHVVGLLRREGLVEELHHAWVGIHRAEGDAVGDSPAAEAKAIGGEGVGHDFEASIGMGVGGRCGGRGLEGIWTSPQHSLSG
jgi:hypothetical protein